MIRVAGHRKGNGSATYEEDADLPLYVSCCGYQNFLTKDFSIQRPTGRLDYQILYIHKGCGHFFIDNEWQTIPAGSIVVYLPSEPQIYTYYAKDTPEIYWIHFSGTQSLDYLQRYHIHNCYIGRHRSLTQLFDEIILELQVHKPFYKDFTFASFLKMLPMIERYYQSQFDSTDNSAMIERLIVELNKSYMDPWSIASMAQYCHLSSDYFSHQFKENTGSSPIQFLYNLRIEKAKELLLTEGLTVSEVAALVGYKDPLYFSRIFKKATGVSPKRFHGNRWLMDESLSL